MAAAGDFRASRGQRRRLRAAVPVRGAAPAVLVEPASLRPAGGLRRDPAILSGANGNAPATNLISRRFMENSSCA